MGFTGKSLSTPFELRLINAALKARVMETYGFPRAYVEIVDTDGSTTTTLATCTNFAIEISREDVGSRFSCVIVNARDWNPRDSDYLGLLTPDIRKRIRIYYGEVITGSVHYVKVYTGVITKKPEAYSFGNSDRITLSGNGLEYVLSKAVGTYSTPTYTGTSKALLQYWFDANSIDYSLSYTDPIAVTSMNVSYASALAGLQAIKQAVGPDTDIYFDSEGRLIFRDLPSWSSDQVEFAYTQSRILSIERNVDVNKVITVVDITGNTSIAVYSGEAAAAYLSKYGRNRFALSTAMVTSAAQATALGTDYLAEGLRWETPFQVGVVLNPYLTIGSYVTLTDSSLSDLTEIQVRLSKISHRFDAMKTRETRFEAYSQ